MILLDHGRVIETTTSGKFVTLAQFDSDCDYCGEVIEEGTQIDKVPGYDWVHDTVELNCAELVREERRKVAEKGKTGFAESGWYRKTGQ